MQKSDILYTAFYIVKLLKTVLLISVVHKTIVVCSHAILFRAFPFAYSKFSSKSRITATYNTRSKANIGNV